MSTDQDTSAWARTHKASYGSDPLIEMKGTEKVTVGFTLDLYASLPMATPPGPERRDAAVALWQRLKEILETALREEGRGARVDIEPMRTAAVLRPENEMQPEVSLRARIVHAEAFQAVTSAERDHMTAFEKRLGAMGLKAGHW